MPNPLITIRDTFLLSDPLDLTPRIDDVARSADGSAIVSVLDLEPLDVQPRTGSVTDYVIGADGLVTEGVVETVAIFLRDVELINGNRVEVDEINDAITITLSDPAGNVVLKRALDTTQISFAEEAVAALPGGGFVVSWLDSQSSPFFGAVKLQFFSDDGQEVSGQIIAGGSDGQTLSFDQLVSVTPEGGVSVIWEQSDTEGLLYQGFDEAGDTATPETALGIDPDGDAPFVSYRADGTFLVATAAGEANVFAADGTAMLAQPINLSSGNEEVLAAALLTDGFVVVTTSQVFAEDGTRLGTEAQVTVYSDDGIVVGEPAALSGFFYQFVSGDVDIAVLDDGGFAVIWQQPGEVFGAQDPILSQVFSTNGDGGITNRAPIILSPTKIELDENSTAPFIVAAQDADGDVLSFSIAGGEDADLFQIDPATGALSFVVAQDFENPSDLDGDALYNVAIGVEDGQGGSLTVPFVVNLINTVEVETDAPDPKDYDAVYIFGNESNDIFPISFADDFAAFLGTNDYIDLSGGNDAVRAGGGDDYIIAGPGQDFQIEGNEGRDIFRFAEGDETVRIRDFTPGEDLIHLAAGLSLDDLTAQTITQSDGSAATRYVTEGGDRLILDGLANGLTQADLYSADSPLPRNFAPTVQRTLVGEGEIDENTNFIGSLTIGDTNEGDQNLQISLSGADASLVSLTSSASNFGYLLTVMNFIDAPNFEQPDDADGDNVYEFTVTATDSDGVSTSTDLAIAVNDVADDVQPSAMFDTFQLGTDGNDLLRGTDGRDYISGGDGSDAIFAGGGADLIDAGSGLDFRVYGGGGGDIFVFDANSERIRVMDFEFGEDKIALGEGIDFADLIIRDWSGFSVLEDGSIESFGGINIIYTDDDGSENRFGISVDGRAPSAGEITADDFVPVGALELPDFDMLS